MSVIIVTKSGQSFQTRDDGKNARGEIVGTQDMIAHLYGEGHQVIYFGATRAENIAGCVAVVRPNTDGVHQYMSWAEQERRLDGDAERLREALHEAGWADDRPPLWVESCGLSASYSLIGNSRSVTPLTSSLRYTAPMLGVMIRLGSPRICLVTDIRSYPRDGEMSDRWPELRPAAVLDQRPAREWEARIAFKDYICKSCDSHSWTWGFFDWLDPEEPSTNLLCGASHCHVGTGFRKKWRDAAWGELLGSEAELLRELGVRGHMSGEGWEHWSGYEHCPEAFVGPTEYKTLMRSLSVSVASPVMAPDWGYLTSKPAIIASRGCLPIFHESWDPMGQIVPATHLCRSGSWHDSLDICRFTLGQRQDIIADLRRRFRQDWSTLDQIVQNYEDGLYWSDEAKWHSRYGGYAQV